MTLPPFLALAEQKIAAKCYAETITFLATKPDFQDSSGKQLCLVQGTILATILKVDGFGKSGRFVYDVDGLPHPSSDVHLFSGPDDADSDDDDSDDADPDDDDKR